MTFAMNFSSADDAEGFALYAHGKHILNGYKSSDSSYTSNSHSSHITIMYHQVIELWSFESYDTETREIVVTECHCINEFDLDNAIFMYLEK